MSASSRPKVGGLAPDFTLPAADGAPVNLAELCTRKVVVLYFYPKDETPGCTVESCTFRDAYEDFVSAGAEVVEREPRRSRRRTRASPVVIVSPSSS